MPVGYGMVKPLLFFLIIVQAVALSQSVWQLLGIIPPNALTENLDNTLQAALSLILYPIEVCVFLFLDTAMNHFFLRLFKADTKGFEGTFRAETYSAAPMLLMIVPYIGLPLAMIGVVVYKFLGLRHVHGATNKQVLAVLILPHAAGHDRRHRPDAVDRRDLMRNFKAWWRTALNKPKDSRQAP